MTDFCPECGKRADLCVCSAEEPLNNRHFVLILQHPQEQDKELGTAKIICNRLKNAALVVALSRPSLKAVLGRDADPKKWGVLYLGAQNETPVATGLYALTKKGTLCPDQAAALRDLEGIILLDGSWSQAKALWWRNPWLLKTQRLLLVPEKRSMYGRLRKEPRKESVSTLEACAQCLTFLGEDGAVAEALTASFSLLLEKYRAARAGKA